MASKEEMRRIIEGYASSGMRRREYCAKHNIAVSTFDYWRSDGASKARGDSAKQICSA